MTITIWKYPVELMDRFSIEMPENSIVLSVGVKENQPYIWAIVNVHHKLCKTQFQLYITGESLSESRGLFIGTFQLNDGALVFHLFMGE